LQAENEGKSTVGNSVVFLFASHVLALPNKAHKNGCTVASVNGWDILLTRYVPLNTYFVVRAIIVDFTFVEYVLQTSRPKGYFLAVKTPAVKTLGYNTTFGVLVT